MERRTREILDLIEDELIKGEQVGKELASLLTALRGPDMGDEDDDGGSWIKWRTTCLLRGEMFPRLAATNVFAMGVGDRGMAIRHRIDEKIIISKVMMTDPIWEHFRTHVEDAAGVLGIVMVVEGGESNGEEG